MGAGGGVEPNRGEGAAIGSSPVSKGGGASSTDILLISFTRHTTHCSNGASLKSAAHGTYHKPGARTPLRPDSTAPVLFMD